MDVLLQRAMQHFDEERRLLHVAITRGKERVFLTYLKATPGQGDGPSPFLAEIMPLAKVHKFEDSDDEASKEAEDDEEE